MKLNKIRTGPAVFYFPGAPDRTLEDLGLKYLRCRDLDGLATRVKLDRRRGVFKETAGDRTYYIKVFFNRKKRTVAKDLFRPDAGVRNLTVLTRLRARGIGTITPVLAAVERGRPLGKRSLCVTEEFSGISLKDFFTVGFQPQRKAEVIEEYVELYVSLLENSFYQRDSNLGNFMVDGRGMVILDVDHIRKIPVIGRFFLKKNLMYLNRSFLRLMKEHPGVHCDHRDREYVLKEVIGRVMRPGDVNRTYARIDRDTVAFMRI